MSRSGSVRAAQCGTFYGPVVFRAMVVVGEGVINMVYWYSEDFPFIAFDIREEESISSQDALAFSLEMPGQSTKPHSSTNKWAVK